MPLAAVFDLAITHVEQRRFDQAEVLLRQVIAASPTHGGAAYLMGVIRAEGGQDSEAENWFAKAAKANPKFAESWGNLGIVLQRQGRSEEAVSAFKQALALAPNYVHALNGLGLSYHSLGRLDDAIAQLSQAVAANPNFSDARNNLGMSLMAAGRLAEAKTHFDAALRLAPSHAEIHNNLGSLAKKEGSLELAGACFARANQLKPDFAEAHANLGIIRFLQGRNDEAKACFHQAEKAGGGAWMRLRAAMALPAVPSSIQDIIEARKELLDTIEDLSEQRLALADPMRQIGMTPFYLAYHGLNDLPLMKALVQLLLNACPALGYTAPHVPGWRGAGDRPVRLGVVSEHLFSHTIGRLFSSLMQALRPHGFELHVFAPRKPGDPLQENLIANSESFTPLPSNLDQARAAVAEARLDILLYTDIGMTPLTWFLAMSRLAPLQASTFGHPNSSGMPSIDIFLTDASMESPAGEEHYSERLIRIPGPMTIYAIPESLQPQPSKADLGLPEGRIYLCPQSLFKLHPEADQNLLSVLKLDPQGHLVLLSGGDPGLDTRLMARLRSAGAEFVSRVHMASRMSRTEFLAMLSYADVMLDPPHYSGGNTTLEALAQGVPVVSWPGEFMRGRHTWGFLNLIGIAQDLAVTDLASYAPLAVSIATSPEKRKDLSDRILAKASILFENHSAVEPIATALKEALKTQVERHG